LTGVDGRSYAGVMNSREILQDLFDRDLIDIRRGR
jgi:hypothetical protein